MILLQNLFRLPILRYYQNQIEEDFLTLIINFQKETKTNIS